MVYRFTHHIILKQLLCTLLVCLQSNRGVAQVSVLPGTLISLSPESDTLFFDENDLYQSASVSGEGILFPENTTYTGIEDNPSVSNVVIKNSQRSVLDNIKINSSVSPEYSALTIINHLQLNAHTDVKMDNVHKHLSAKNIYNFSLNSNDITEAKINSMYADNYILLFLDIEHREIFWGRLPFYVSISTGIENILPKFDTFSNQT